MEKALPLRVLVIDDEEPLIRSFKLAFKDSWDVDGLTDPHELARDMVGGFRRFQLYDLIFLDLLFDKSKITPHPLELNEELKGEMLGFQFLHWLQKNYTQPVIILSGNIFNDVGKRLREEFPYIKALSKPVNLYDPNFRYEMEHYALTFYRRKRQVLFDEPYQAILDRTASDLANKD